jgi:ribosomal protein L37E
MIALGFRSDTGKEVVALMAESVEVEEGRKKFWEGDCLHKGDRAFFKLQPEYQTRLCACCGFPANTLGPQEARRMQKDTIIRIEGACDRI